MSNQQNETNPQVNQKSFPQEEKFNLNINYILDNTPIEEIKKKIYQNLIIF